ncbi:MAG: pyridoxine 5'-phosphate synthase [Rhodobiaceae bacterium]
MTENTLRLGVNIDHVATLRNARGGDNPDPVRAALAAQAAGADGITAHLREDRRHIRDADIHALKDAISLPLNFEMAATGEMVDIACEVKPNAACIVPERREEVTTEGGLAVAGREAELTPFFNRIRDAGIRLSLFIEASEAEIRAAAAVGADIVELHTGRYCHDAASSASELTRITEAAALADSLGLECHAGHGLDYDTVGAIAAIPQMHELNIGHFLMGESLFVGFDAAIDRLRRLMDEARAS